MLVDLLGIGYFEHADKKNKDNIVKACAFHCVSLSNDVTGKKCENYYFNTENFPKLTSQPAINHRFYLTMDGNFITDMQDLGEIKNFPDLVEHEKAYKENMLKMLTTQTVTNK